MKPSLADLIALLGRVKHFQHWTKAERAAIVHAGHLRTFGAGRTIYREGEDAAGMFVLLSGHVHLIKLGPRGQHTIVTEINPVIMFNEVTVLDGDVNLTTALAAQDCVTWHIGYAEFQSLLRRHPTLGTGLLRLLARRMRMLMAQYEDLSFRSVTARTAKLLLDVSARGTQPISRRDYSNTILAARICTVPEAFSRSLHLLRQSGAVECTRATITITRTEILEQYARGERDTFVQ